MKHLTILMGALVLTGCASKAEFVKPKNTDPIDIKILEAANAIQKKFNQLHQLESARKYEVTGKNMQEFDLSHLPALESVISLGGDWNGPLDKLLIKLSAVAGMEKPRFLNIKPASDVVVSVDVEYRRVIDIIKDAYSQSGSKVNMTIKMKERLIEVEYVGL